MYLHILKIGNVELENNIFLAPMAGITDLPFRLICEKFNPGLVTTEMISSKAIQYGDEKTKKLMNIANEKVPVAIQIFGSDPEAMAYTTNYLVNNIEKKDVNTYAKTKPDIIDINMGCPVPKVTKNGDGSKLLTDLNKAEEVIKAVVKNAKIQNEYTLNDMTENEKKVPDKYNLRNMTEYEKKVPVTLKIRTGWDSDHIVAVEIAKIAEKAGVSAITVHGRTREQYYSGKADWEIIKQVKQAVSIPVIGNGDIIDEFTAGEMLEKTGVDGIMIGRAALGNPWIFEKVNHFLQYGNKLPDRTLKEKFDLIKEHLELEIEEKGEYTGIREFRKHIAYYTKGLPNSSEFRSKINVLENKEEILTELKKLFK